MKKARRLPGDRFHHLGMRMTRRTHGDASVEIQKVIAIHILDHRAKSSLDDQWIRASVRRRDVLSVLFQDGCGLGAREFRLDLWKFDIRLHKSSFAWFMKRLKVAVE
jgi:hypothetical protein